MLIRLTFKNKKKRFVCEAYNAMHLTDDIQEAFNYQSVLEFKVTWNLLNLYNTAFDAISKSWLLDKDYNKENVVKFEVLDKYSLKTKSFDVNKKEPEVGDEIHVDPATFKRLISCGITSSNFCYDKDDKWIDEKDHDKIIKIRYYYRGLVNVISSHNGYNWSNRYNECWHGCYRSQWECMKHPIIQRLALEDRDSCSEIMVYKKELK